jgi:hypothetical protein
MAATARRPKIFIIIATAFALVGGSSAVRLG